MEPRSVRLNYSNRQTFINTALNKLMPGNTRPTVENFYREKRAVIYDYIYGTCKEYLAQLPSWTTVKTKTITVMLGNEILRFTLPNEVLAFENGVFNSDKNAFNPICKLSEFDPLSQEFAAAKQQTVDWDTKRTALRDELTKVVNACNTSAQLYQAWPKSLEFAQCFPYKGSKAAPKVKVSSAALDMTMSIAKTTVGSPDEN
jgi:hypothetical protein